ncbi:alpha/beta fold hydrolase [Novosphingobium sp. THN1]|uniref:alpha/beta fold hydrolase n=1 Tax=Novosphingobium sp. THN1 TaxID=1016987 RepID=UPI0026BE3FD8
MPTLVIHGTSDATVPIEATGRAVARAVPHATLIEYDGEPHGVFATQTERLTKDLLDFVSGRPAETMPQEVIDTLTAQTIVAPSI